MWWESPAGSKRFDYHSFLYDEEYPEWSSDSAESRYTISSPPESLSESLEAQRNDGTNEDTKMTPSYLCRPFFQAGKEEEEVNDSAHALASVTVICEMCQHTQCRLQQQLEKAIAFGTRTSVVRRELEAARLGSASSCGQCLYVRKQSEQEQRRVYLEAAAGGCDPLRSPFLVGNPRACGSGLTSSAHCGERHRFPSRQATIGRSRNVPAWLKPKAPTVALDTSSVPSSSKLNFEQGLSPSEPIGDRLRRYQRQHQLAQTVSKASSAASTPSHNIITGPNTAGLIASPTQLRHRMHKLWNEVVGKSTSTQVVAASTRLKFASIGALPSELEAPITDGSRRFQASKKYFRSCLPGTTSNASIRQRTKPGVRSASRYQQNQDQGQTDGSTGSSTDYRDSDPVAQHSVCRSRTDVVEDVGRWLAGLDDRIEEDVKARPEWDGVVWDAAGS